MPVGGQAGMRGLVPLEIDEFFAPLPVTAGYRSVLIAGVDGTNSWYSGTGVQVLHSEMTLIPPSARLAHFHCVYVVAEQRKPVSICPLTSADVEGPARSAIAGQLRARPQGIWRWSA